MLQAVGIGALYPLLARIQAAHHLPTYGLGLMSGASFFAALAGQVGISRWLDGRRARTVLWAGMAVSAVSYLWFAEAGSLWALTAARAMGGVGYGVVGPASLRAGTVGVPPERRGSRLGRLASAQMAGIAIGPLVGTGLAAVGDLKTPFLVVAALLAALTVALAVLPEDRTEAAEISEDRPLVHRSARPPWRPVLALLLLACAAQLPVGFYDALWSRLLTDRGASSLLIGLSLTLFGLPFIVLAPAGGRLAARTKPLVASAIAVAVSAGFMASYGWLASPILICILGVFEACAQSVAVPGGYAAVAEVFPDDWAATGQGWFIGAGTAAAGVSALCSAAAYAAIGAGWVFTGGALLSSLFVVASLLAARGLIARPPC